MTLADGQTTAYGADTHSVPPAWRGGISHPPPLYTAPSVRDVGHTRLCVCAAWVAAPDWQSSMPYSQGFSRVLRRKR